MRCAIYARYSSDMQKERSIDDQVRNCRDFAKRQGWEVLENHIYSDKAVSGASLAGRIQLNRLLDVASAKPRPFDYVLVDDTSRLSRDKIDQMSVIEEFHSRDVYLFFVSQNIDTADEQATDVLVPMHGIVDSLYLRDLAKKTQRGMAGQVLEGYSPGGRIYGYEYSQVPDPSGVIDKKTRQPRVLGTKIEINEEQAEVVRKMFDLYSAGIGLKEITNRLNTDGIEPPGASKQRSRFKIKPSWCPSAVRYILKNPKYIGDWTWNKYRWIKNRGTGKRTRRLRPEEEWVKYENKELAIVSDSVFDSVQRRFAANKRAYQAGARAQRKSYLFTGLLKCAICGANYTIVGGPKKGEQLYACSVNWHRGKSVCPNNVRVHRERLEETLLSAIQEQVCEPKVIARIVEKVNHKLQLLESSRQSNLPALENKRDRIQTEIENLVAYVASAGDTSPAIQSKLREKEAELSDTKRQIEEVSPDVERTSVHVDPNLVAKKLSNIRTLLYSNVTAARAILMRMTDKIELSPVVSNRSKHLRAEGNSNVVGMLELTNGLSTRNYSGGWI